MSADQAEALKRRTGPRAGVPRDTQRKRRLAVAVIEAEATAFAHEHLDDPLWVAGTALYWAEGAKTQRTVALANSDAALIRCYLSWCRRFHTPSAEFALRLHLHAGNDEHEAMSYWRRELGLPEAPFHKTFLKPAGTGHRKNHLAFGVCRALMRRSADAFVATMRWIEILGTEAGRLPPPNPALISSAGR